MKSPKTLLTHTAVFSAGIAAAMILNGTRSPQAGADAAGQSGPSRTNSSSASGTSIADSRAPRSGNDDSRGTSKRETKSATEQLQGIARITDAFQRQRALMDLIDKLGPDEFAGVAEQYRQMDHFGDSRGEYELILRGWAKADPLAALDFAAKNPNGGRASATILSTWAGNDAAAAERWALDHFDGEGANPYLASVIRGIATTDINHASQLAQSMPTSRERGDAVDAITDALFMQGVDAAMAFPLTIADETLRGGFVDEIAGKLVEKNPDQAAAWLAAVDQGAVQNRAAREVGEALALQDTAKAAAWVTTLKPEAQAEAARGIIDIMSASDIPGTARWVSSLAGTPGYDNVVEEFVWSCNTRAPEQAAAWIQGVANADQQRRLYHRMLGEWAQKDAAAVRDWVNSNNVPDNVRQRFSR